MIPWEVLGREEAPGGGELVLARRGQEYSIRVGNQELMSSRAHASEEALARLACERIGGRGRAKGGGARPRAGGGGSAGGAAYPRVLVGGLGMGFSLRAALDALPAEARVTVAEIVPAVIAWNRGPLGSLAGSPLSDPRVEVDARDVALVLAEERARFDAILLDVDNGPVHLTRRANEGLYGASGLALARCALRAGGVLAIWSAAPHEGFEKYLEHAGFTAEAHPVAPREGSRGRKHVIYIALA